MTVPDDLRRAALEWRDDDPDPATRAEVDELLARDDGAGLEDRFGTRLEFGTAGLRGAEGAGPNRMNRALVRRATAGVARWLLDTGRAGDRPAVVGRDARHGSAAFAADAAAVLTGAGIPCVTFAGVVPTPVLAYAVLHVDACAGVMVTASHNPAADNGYKLYAGDGAQIVPPMDSEISARIDSVGPLADLALAAEAVGSVPEDVVDAYVAAAAGLSVAPRHRDVRLAYTALHGVGQAVALRVLEAAGFAAPAVVAEQAEPDPDFPTVAFPNPEEPGAMDRLVDLARDRDADLAIANDPDADRLAVAVPDPDAPGGWRALSGDEIGAALGDWRLEHDGTGPDRLVATTIVSSSLLGKLAAEHGVAYAETLTGFKWLARAGLARPDLHPVLAYEEALGCSVGRVVRDKDGMSAAMAFAELVAAEKAAGRTVQDRLDDVARRHGVHRTAQRSVRFDGPGALARSSA
ncbi:MAG: phospho-sugar mutase, partial [Acidimicrobiia bacterium]|nr:phospho-sugar mutase [Acidimicrobiia bacterium]